LPNWKYVTIHYPALGVSQGGEAADREKLFDLIQRVKMAVPSDVGMVMEMEKGVVQVKMEMVWWRVCR